MSQIAAQIAASFQVCVHICLPSCLPKPTFSVCPRDGDMFEKWKPVSLARGTQHRVSTYPQQPMLFFTEIQVENVQRLVQKLYCYTVRLSLPAHWLEVGYLLSCKGVLAELWVLCPATSSCVYIILSISVSNTCLNIWLSPIHLHFHLSVCMSVYLSIHLCLSISLLACLSVGIAIHLLIYQLAIHTNLFWDQHPQRQHSEDRWLAEQHQHNTGHPEKCVAWCLALQIPRTWSSLEQTRWILLEPTISRGRTQWQEQTKLGAAVTPWQIQPKLLLHRMTIQKHSLLHSRASNALWICVVGHTCSTHCCSHFLETSWTQTSPLITRLQHTEMTTPTIACLTRVGCNHFVCIQDMPNERVHANQLDIPLASAVRL